MKSKQPEKPATNLIALINRLPTFLQYLLLRIAFLQRSQTYITNMPGMIPMLDENKRQTPQLQAELSARGLAGTKSIFINANGIILHALYFPPANGKLVCAFHGIKGNWLNNPMPIPPNPDDVDYDPKYRMVLLEELAKNGFGFLAFTMPGFEPSRGSASEANFIKACGAFASYTKNLALKLKIKPQDIIACGESLGAANAAIFASKLTEKDFPPGVLSLIAPFSSLVSMTQMKFPSLDESRLRGILAEKLDTAARLHNLDRSTYIHIVTAQDDTVIPMKETEKLIAAARRLGFQTHHHHTEGQHTTWDKAGVVGGKATIHHARTTEIEIAEVATVADIQAILAGRNSTSEETPPPDNSISPTSAKPTHPTTTTRSRL